MASWCATTRPGTFRSPARAVPSNRPVRTWTKVGLMLLPSAADNVCKGGIGRSPGCLEGNRMGSFKLKLVVYFSVISLLPFAAAFSGLEAVTDRNETRRVDGILETGVRAGLARFADEVAAAEGRAADLARDPAFQRALARRDRRALTRILRDRPNLRVEARNGIVVGQASGAAVERSVVVRGRRGRL